MAVSVEHITVSFPGIRALDEVSLTFEDGHVHGVLGANGSGKSTLVKVLTGVYQPDGGSRAQITIDTKQTNAFADPAAAQEMGIRVVHQEAPLIGSLSVAESVALFTGYPKKACGLIRWNRLYAYTEELFRFYNIKISPKAYVKDLTAAERSMVAMSIALGKEEDLKKTKVLILDEADASIPEGEAELFLNHVKKISQFGIPVIMVTHRLKAVKAICDDVTILNDGNVVFSGASKDITESEMIEKMLRKDQVEAVSAEETDKHELREIWKLSNKQFHADTEQALVVKDLVAKTIDHLSFSVQRGEILGIVGVGDSGVNELPMLLFGDKKKVSGEIFVDGTKLPERMSPRKAIRHRLMLQPADRLIQGGVMTLSLRDNLQLPDEKNYWHKRKLDRNIVDLSIREFDIRPGMAQMPFGKFSGGNQQKAIVAKWMKLRPSVLVMDDPTYGVDPAARQKIFASMKTASQTGISMVVFSTEPEQLVYVCTRILVLKKGKIIQELHKEDGSLTREAIARWCYS